MVEHTERANEKPSEALQNYLKVVEETSDTSFANDGERMQALSATYALMSRLETPWETLLRLCAGQVNRRSRQYLSEAKSVPAGYRGCFKSNQRP